jgi:hypothetical protein
MFGLKVQIEDRFKRVEKAANDAAFRNVGHAAASISKDAKATIEKSDAPSQPGEPPHTKKNQLKRAIRFAAEKDGAAIGPMFSIMGTSAEAHEFGKQYKGQDFPERPFMGPALERALPRFLQSWQGAVTE